MENSDSLWQPLKREKPWGEEEESLRSQNNLNKDRFLNNTCFFEKKKHTIENHVWFNIVWFIQFLQEAQTS